MADNTGFSKFESLRSKAENLLQDQNVDVDPSRYSSMMELIEELKVHQAELEVQNQELKRAQEEISSLHQEYQELYEFAPCGYITLDAKGMINKVNLTGARLLGTTRKGILAMNQFLAPESRDSFYRLLQESKEGPAKAELKLIQDEQSCSWVGAEVQAKKDQAGEVLEYRMVLHDITLQKLAQNKNQHLNTVLQAIRNINQLIIQEKDRDALLQKSCDNLVQTRGYHNAWIALLDDHKRLEGFYHAGLGDMAGPLKAHLENERPLYCLDGVVQGQAVLVVDDPYERCSGCPVRSSYKSRAGLCARLEHQGRFFGVLTVSTPDFMAHDQEELKLFNELAHDIAFALHNLDREREREHHLETLRMYELIISTVKDPMSIVDRNYVYQEVNQAYLDTFAKKREEIVGYTVEDLLGSEAFYNIVKPRLDRCFQGEEVYYEAWLDTYPGNKACLSVYYHPYLDTRGEVQGVVVNVRDVTERKHAEDVLKHYRQRLEEQVQQRTAELEKANQHNKQALYFNELLLNSLAEGIFGVDSQRRFTFLNPAAVELLGFTEAKEALGENSHVLTHHSRPDGSPLPEHECPIYRVMHTGQPLEIWEDLFWRMDGSSFPVEVLAAPMKDDQDQVVGVVVSFRDITKQKEAEIKEKEHLEQLQQASKMVALGTLVSSVGHEINNPNNLIMLNTPMIQEAWQDALPILEEHSTRHGDFHLAGIPFSDIRQHLPSMLSGIIEGSQRIKNIVADLKDFARQNYQQNFQKVDLNQVVEKAVRLTQYKISKHTDNFQVVFGEDLPAISGDYQKLEQVVMNLLLNACQALNYRSEAVILRTLWNPEEGAVLLEVEDEGCGIDPHDQERLLDPFFTTRPREGGTGLGLSITSSIVQGHGGQLEYYSQPDQGTIFRVYLPAAVVSE